MKKYRQKIAVVHEILTMLKDNPINISGIARKAHLSSGCAREFVNLLEVRHCIDLVPSNKKELGNGNYKINERGLEFLWVIEDLKSKLFFIFE